MVSILQHPERQGSMRRSLSGSSAACLYEPEVLWLWTGGVERLIGPLARLPRLWHELASRPQCRQEYREGRAGPSGRRGVSCVGEPSIRQAVARAECQRKGGRINGDGGPVPAVYS